MCHPLLSCFPTKLDLLSILLYPLHPGMLTSVITSPELPCLVSVSACSQAANKDLLATE